MGLNLFIHETGCPPQPVLSPGPEALCSLRPYAILFRRVRSSTAEVPFGDRWDVGLQIDGSPPAVVFAFPRGGWPVLGLAPFSINVSGVKEKCQVVQ